MPRWLRPTRGCAAARSARRSGPTKRGSRRRRAAPARSSGSAASRRRAASATARSRRPSAPAAAAGARRTRGRGPTRAARPAAGARGSGTPAPARTSTPAAIAISKRERDRAAVHVHAIEARNARPAQSAAAGRAPRRSTTRPTAPPAAASTRLSVSICRTSRPRSAPSAMRILISRVRPAARTSSRLPTLAQAISSTQPTAASRISSAGRAAATTVSCSGTTAMFARCGWRPDTSASSCVAIADISSARLLDADLGLQPRDDAEDPVLAIALRRDRRVRRLRARQPERHPELGPGDRKVERRRHHADDQRRRAVEHRLAADDVRVAAEAPFPQSVSEHRHWSRAGHVVVCSSARVRSSGGDAEDAEEIVRAGGRLHLLRIAAVAGEVDARAPVRRDAGE